MDRKIGDYVIVHELLHFAVPHHGKLWKALMRAHVGDYEKLDHKLRRRGKHLRTAKQAGSRAAFEDPKPARA